MKYNGEAVGFEIKMKVYRALMDLRTKELLKGTGLSDGVVSDPLGDSTDLLDAYSVLEDDAEPSSSG